ncbi:MAG: hypothetical protein JNL90_03480 [Planctomycetes bacterium]|nr:hypothetical protein [Planctomycetota bacterium]
MASEGVDRQSTRRKALAVWAALCSGPVVLPVVASFVPPLLGTSSDAEFLRGVMVVPAGTVLLVALLWRVVLLPRALAAKKFADEVAAVVAAQDAATGARTLIERSDERFFAMNLVGIALSEGGGLFAGIGLLLLGVQWLPGALAVGLSLALLAAHCPTAARFDDAAHRVAAAAGLPLGESRDR